LSLEVLHEVFLKPRKAQFELFAWVLACECYVSEIHTVTVSTLLTVESF